MLNKGQSDNVCLHEDIEQVPPAMEVMIVENIKRPRFKFQNQNLENPTLTFERVGMTFLELFSTVTESSFS